MCHNDTCEIITQSDHSFKSYDQKPQCSRYVYHWMRQIRFRVKFLCLLQTAISEGAPVSTVCSTPKAVCSVDEARALMKLVEPLHQPARKDNSALEGSKAHIFIPSCLLPFQKIVTVSIKTQFLGRARPSSTTWVPCYPPRLVLGHHLWSRHGVLRSKGVF